MLQVSVRRYLQGILLILHLTGEGNSLPPVWQYLKCVCYSCYCCQLCVLVVVCAFPACVTGMAGRCSLFGRDHIHTFDGVLYQFPGDCSYLLAGDCNHRSFSLLGEMVWLLLWFVLHRYVCKSNFPCVFLPYHHYCALANCLKNPFFVHPQVILWMAEELGSPCFLAMHLNFTCLSTDSSLKEKQGLRGKKWITS